VDDKYEYSCESRNDRVHGWMSIDPLNSTGFWLITPSYEFRSAGPLKQYLTSHVGPTTLSVRLFANIFSFYHWIVFSYIVFLVLLRTIFNSI